MSYSQYDEERYVLEAVAGIKFGRLLDLGAWNATEFSNSRALIEAGWEAILVEPSPEPFLGLVKAYGNHPKVQLLNAAIGDGSLVEMHATADAVSTADPKVFERWKYAGGYYGSFWARTFTLADLFRQFGSQWDFVSIDTEGSSGQVFTELMAAIQNGATSFRRPQCICLEHDQPTTENFEQCAVAQLAKASGYRQLYLNGTNVVYSR